MSSGSLQDTCGLQETDYWGRLKALRLQSLQRRRERYIIIHVWKLLHEKVPNDINMEFYYTGRLGWRARLPKLYGRAKTSAKTLYDASFAVQGAKFGTHYRKMSTPRITLIHSKCTWPNSWAEYLISPPQLATGHQITTPLLTG